MTHDDPRLCLEADPRFPSGPWGGYYQEGGIQARQRLNLTFAGGTVTGFGSDPVGPFTMRGVYDVESGKVSMVKTYPTHRVEYDGLADGDGIGGGWMIRYEMGLTDRGRFRIWPDELAMGEANRVKAEEPVPVGA